MWKSWEIVLAIVLGVAANLVTPYIKGSFRRGFIGLRKFRVEALEASIRLAHFYNKNPAWLILYLMKELFEFLILLVVTFTAAWFITQFTEQPRRWITPLVSGVLGLGLATLVMAIKGYYQAMSPAKHETETRIKIAKIIGNPPAALNNDNSD